MVLITFWSCQPVNPEALPPHILAIDSVVVISGSLSETGSIQLVKELAFKDSLLLDQITALEVDTEDNLYIAGESWNRRQIHIYNNEGFYKDSLGSYGIDSGQFLEISRLQLRNDNLYVFDDQLNRITTFDIESGETIDTLGLHPAGNHLPDNWSGFHAAAVTIRDDGSYLMAFQRDRDPADEPEGELRYYIVDESGKVLSDVILIQPDIKYLVGDYAGRPAPFTLPLPEKPLLQISENGRVYSAYTNKFLINVLNAGGENLHSYYNRGERYKLDPHEVIHPRFSHNDQLRRVRESAEYPEKWPTLYSLLTDDENRIWISTITDNRDMLKWWIIDDQTGTLAATFSLPFDQPIYHVKNGAVYTVEKKDSGFKKVVRYKIQMPG
ncbi:hypothetical protein BH23BAC3_BH23BAC3_17440 [soil metagenome]